MKKSFITFFLLISLIFGISAQVVNDSQILKENHWIYDYFEIISLEDKFTSLDTKPISVGELKVYLKQIDFEKLSENGKNLYNKIHDYLYTTSYIGKQKLLNNGIFNTNLSNKFRAGCQRANTIHKATIAAINIGIVNQYSFK